MRLLIVEDDPLIGDGLVAGLKSEGYQIDWVQDGASALTAVKTDNFDLIVLDLGLPDMTGLNVLDHIRHRKTQTAVIILTAWDSTDDRVKGLDHGADDYLIKPFEMSELKARLRSLRRRLFGREVSSIEFGELVIEPHSKRVFRNGQEVSLVAKEFLILLHLSENRGRVHSKRQLEDVLYGWSDGVESNTVEVYIHQLRQKLGSTVIRTIRGLGYVIESDHE